MQVLYILYQKTRTAQGKIQSEAKTAAMIAEGPPKINGPNLAARGSPSAIDVQTKALPNNVHSNQTR